jgi:hypothetical protein
MLLVVAQMIELVVEDRRSYESSGTYPTHTFKVERHMPIKGVRALLFSKLGIEESSLEGGGRFRRGTVGGFFGTLIEDENDTLSQCGIADGGGLVLEQGRRMCAGEMSLRCVSR